MNKFACGPMRPAHKYTAPVLDTPMRNVVLYSQGSGPFSPSHSFQTVKDEQSGTESQVLQILGLPVFRSGTFKDSLGDLATWETLHIDQMVSSFSFLREQQVFADVPVREGHGSFFGDPMTGLVGYHTGLSAQDAQAPDGNTYRYLLADFTLNKPEAQQAYLNGLWRNRSSEVGYFESNSGTGYYPVYQGFAFVDIPAVQFLNLFGKEKKRSFSVLLEKEISMTVPVTPAAPQTVNPDGSAAPGESGGQQPNAPANGGGTQNHSTANGQPTPAAPAATSPANGSGQSTPPNMPIPAPAVPGQHSFMCGGQQVQDFGAVQSYIAKLEGDVTTLSQFRQESVRAGRINYVKKLAADKKILVSQVGSDEAGKEDGLVGLALSLSDDQFTSWSKSYDSLPVNPLFSAQPNGGTGDPATTDISEDEKEYAKYKDQVSWHRSANMPKADLEKTTSWKKYSELHTKLGKKGEL